ncbi:MAG TPA: transposase [Vicinamibacterales bacterium]
MARLPRIQIVDLPHHIINRGNGRRDIFVDDQDHQVFLLALGDASGRHQLDVHAYALMSNHFHIVATPRTATGLSEAMRMVGTKYVGYFNRRYARTGGLFEGRFKSSVIDTDTYWFTCMRYVELNPVRAQVVSDPADYRWSSYRSNALGVHDRLIVPHHLYTSLGESAVDRQQSWRELCGEAIPEEQLFEIREAARCGGALSDAAYRLTER